MTVSYQPSMHASSGTEAENKNLQLAAINSFLSAMQQLPEIMVSSLCIYLPSFLRREAGTGDVDWKLLYHPRQTRVQYWAIVGG